MSVNIFRCRCGPTAASSSASIRSRSGASMKDSSRADVCERPVANNVTSWPAATSPSQSPAITRSVPPYRSAARSRTTGRPGRCASADLSSAPARPGSRHRSWTPMRRQCLATGTDQQRRHDPTFPTIDGRNAVRAGVPHPRRADQRYGERVAGHTRRDRGSCVPAFTDESLARRPDRAGYSQ